MPATATRLLAVLLTSSLAAALGGSALAASFTRSIEIGVSTGSGSLSLSCVAGSFAVASIRNQSLSTIDYRQGCANGTTAIVTDGTLDVNGDLDTGQPWTSVTKSTMAPDETGTTIVLEHEGKHSGDVDFLEPFKHDSIGDYTFQVPGASGTEQVTVAVSQVLPDLTGVEDYEEEVERLELLDSTGTLVADLTGLDGSQTFALTAGETYTLSTELQTEYTNLPAPSAVLLLGSAAAAAAVGRRRRGRRRTTPRSCAGSQDRRRRRGAQRAARRNK